MPLSRRGESQRRRAACAAGGSPDLDLLAHYRQAIGVRNAHGALRGGEMETLLVDDAAHLYGFVRWDAAEKVVVALNNGPASQTATVPVAEHLANGTVLTDTLTGQTYTVAQGEVIVPLPARWGRGSSCTPSPRSIPCPT